MARLFLLDIVNNESREVECDKLQDFYEYLNCSCIDIANRELSGKRFDIFVDDEGLLKDNPMVSALSKDFKPMLIGNLIFANHDGAGNTTDLTDGDIRVIKRHIFDNISSYRGGKQVRVGKMLIGLEY